MNEFAPTNSSTKATARLNAEPPFRAGDLVEHVPSNMILTVAYADPVTDDLAWCGWPSGLVRTSECVLSVAASDEQHQSTMRALAESGDRRGRHAIRLYGAPSSATRPRQTIDVVPAKATEPGA